MEVVAVRSMDVSSVPMMMKQTKFGDDFRHQNHVFALVLGDMDGMDFLHRINQPNIITRSQG